MGEFIQIRPLKEEENKAGSIQLATVTKQRPAKGEVISVGDGRHLADGTFVKPPVEVGDIVVYNPHLFVHELKQDGQDTIIVSTNAIYGKMIHE